MKSEQRRDASQTLGSLALGSLALGGRAKAHSNIALAKYWGKVDERLNLPAVPSLSMTLDAFFTETEVLFDERLKTDQVFLDGKALRKTKQTEKELKRVIQVLDWARRESGIDLRAKVVTHNNFPTAAGLASSASGFAALVSASAVAANLKWSSKKLSGVARKASASAARSMFGGFVELPAGKKGNDELFAKQVASEDSWDVRLVVAMVDAGRKKVGSTQAMIQTAKTSPLYEAWVEQAPAMFRQVKRGLKERDLDRLGAAMEKSTYAFHATAMTASPSVLYWKPETLAVLHAVRLLRDNSGKSVWATMDAGPHVKVLCHNKDAQLVRNRLRSLEGVQKVVITRPGQGVSVCPL